MKKMLMLAAGYCFLLACNNNKPAETNSAATDTTAKTTEQKPPPQSEFADAKFTDIGKKNLQQLSSGDIDGWMNSFADNAKYRWSSGDSLEGKAAIATYWKERRTKVIDSITFINDIWLPIKINKPQKGPDSEGNWLLSWYMVNVKYKNGKKLMFWVHTDMHFDANDKIDQFIQYIDRAPINKALGMH
ncbi:MAG TPA: nuclear transport factor 2 family protein [Puia sp.]|nr:nuclear transport factor 2 family protein [Puia sp.]